MSPYFDHDAFMHHALHVLDAPAKHNHAIFAFTASQSFPNNVQNMEIFQCDCRQK